MGESSASLAYVRSEDAPRLPAPPNMVGWQGWLRANLFSSPLNAVLTLLVAAFLAWVGWQILDFAVVRAVWSGTTREACIIEGGVTGACWPLAYDKGLQWLYGFYPIDQRWRVNIVLLMAALGLVPMLIPSVPYKSWNALFLLTAFPLLAIILLTGGHFNISWLWFALAVGVAGIGAGLAVSRGHERGPVRWIAGGAGALLVLWLLRQNFGLEPVETDKWGGMLVTLVVATTGIVASLPIGILLALGRRSQLPVVKWFSVAFIELWRGVPLITVLFFASVMLPLFLPPGIVFDKLLRALVGVSLFSAAYMAEVVRAGLQAIPRGQYEGAQALGLGYWQMMRMIVLPQALKISIPNIVGNFISLFKDTTLVSIIGLFDLLGMVRAGLKDADWATPVTVSTGLFSLGLIYWVFCFGMSRYSMYTERRLHTGHKR